MERWRGNVLGWYRGTLGGRQTNLHHDKVRIITEGKFFKSLSEKKTCGTKGVYDVANHLICFLFQTRVVKILSKAYVY